MKKRVVGLVVVAAAAWASPGIAAEGRLPSTVEPGREHPVLPPPPTGEFDFSIVAPKRSAVPRDVETLRFVIHEIVVDGATALSTQTLAALVAPLRGREGTLADIMTVAEGIEARYREAGYLLTRAFVPPQRTRAGVFKIQVVEGYIKSVAVDGAEGATAQRLAAILAPVENERPLRNATMERALLLANDLPGVKASGLLKPARDETGAADLVVSVTQRPTDVVTSADNRASRYEGPWVANADAAVYSALGRGERIGVGVSSTPDTQKKKAYRLNYLQPVGVQGLTASASADYSRSHLGYTLAEDDVRTNTLTVGGRLAYPLLRGRLESLTLDGGVAVKSAKTDIAGSGYSDDTWRTADLRLAWTHAGWLGGADSAAVGVVQGLPVAGASRAGESLLSRDRATPSFTKATLDVGRVQGIAPLWDVYLGASGQYAWSTVVASEEFALGGATYGHGFDPSALVGDHGIGGTASLRYDASSLAPFGKTMQLYSFYDGGVTWTNNLGGKQGLGSFGGGVRLGLTDQLDTALEFAHRLYGADATAGGHFARVYFTVLGRF